MANYNALKAAIQSVIKANGNNEITGVLLQQSLLSMISSLGSGFQFVGFATPITNPGTSDEKIYYIAKESGTYVHFDNLVVPENTFAILYFDNRWNIDYMPISGGGAQTLGGLSNVTALADNIHVEDKILVRRANASGANSWSLAPIPSGSIETLGALKNVADGADQVQTRDKMLIRRANASGANSWSLADIPSSAAQTLGGLDNVSDDADNVQTEDKMLVRRANAYGVNSWSLAPIPSGGNSFFESGTGSNSLVRKNAENVAQGADAVAIGSNGNAGGNESFTTGYTTVTTNRSEFACGSLNVSHHNENIIWGKDNTLFSIGASSFDILRENAVEIMQNCDYYVKGIGGYNGRNPNTDGVRTLQEVLNQRFLSEIEVVIIDADKLYISIPTELQDIEGLSVEIARHVVVRGGSKVRKGIYIIYDDGGGWVKHKGWKKLGLPYSVTATLGETESTSIPGKVLKRVIVTGSKGVIEQYSSMYQLAQSFFTPEGIRHSSRKVKMAKWGLRLSIGGLCVTPWLPFHLTMNYNQDGVATGVVLTK